MILILLELQTPRRSLAAFHPPLRKIPTESTFTEVDDNIAIDPTLQLSALNQRQIPPVTPEVEQSQELFVYNQSRIPTEEEDDDDNESCVNEDNQYDNHTPKRIRLVQHPRAAEYEKDKGPKDKEYVRRIRWMYLLQFGYQNVEHIISEVYHVESETEYEFTSAWLHVQNLTRNWKHKCLQEMKISIQPVFINNI